MTSKELLAAETAFNKAELKSQIDIEELLNEQT